MRRVWIFVLAAVLTLCGCLNDIARSDGGILQETIPGKEILWDGNVVVQPAAEGEIVPLEETLYEMLAQTSAEKNLLLSPFSMNMVMTMVYHCTEGEARAEMETFLGIDGSEEDVFANRSALRQVLLEKRSGIEMTLADSFWVRKQEETQTEELEQKLKEYYDCDVFPVEHFSADVLAEINRWSDEKTDGMIPLLLDQLDEEATLVLVDALYFNGTWKTLFQPKDSFEGDFYGFDAGELSTRVEYMKLENGTYSYACLDGVRAIELPYGKEGSVVMDVFIAQDGGGLNYHALFQNNAAQMKQILAVLDQGERQMFAKLILPKWKESYDIQGLENVFAQSGLEKVFEVGAMPKISRLTGLDRVLQKTAIEVTEHGTKAAASSAVVMTEAALPSSEHLFVVDHNFAYVIRDLGTGEILFAGVVNQLGE